MTTLASFPSMPRGVKIHQPESQSCCNVVAAGISFALVGSPGMGGDGYVVVHVCCLSVSIFQEMDAIVLVFH